MRVGEPRPVCAITCAPCPPEPAPAALAPRPAPQLLCQSFQMAGEQDRRILKAAATSKRSKGSGGAAAAATATDAKTFQAGVGGQADAASLLLEGLLLKVGLPCRLPAAGADCWALVAAGCRLQELVAGSSQTPLLGAPCWSQRAAAAA